VQVLHGRGSKSCRGEKWGDIGAGRGAIARGGAKALRLTLDTVRLVPFAGCVSESIYFGIKVAVVRGAKS
jgi:hypothetical protein